MSHWTFLDFVEPSGRIPFIEWAAGLPDDAQAFIDARILQMSGLERWPEKWISKYRGTEKILELRVQHKKVQYRPLGIYGQERRSFVLLAGAIEKGVIPREIIDAAVRRQKLLEVEPDHVRPHSLY